MKQGPSLQAAAGGGGGLNFHFGIDVQPEGLNKGDKGTDYAKFGTLMK